MKIHVALKDGSELIGLALVLPSFFIGSMTLAIMGIIKLMALAIVH